MSTPVFNLHDLILIMTIAVALTLALFQPIASNKRPHANLWLGIFFISLAFNALCTLLVWNLYLKPGVFTQALLPYLLGAAALGKGPALYFYVVSLTNEKPSYRSLQLLHLLPILMLAILIAVFGIDSQALLFNVPELTPGIEFALHSFWYSIKILPLVYYLAAIFYVWRYRRYLKENYSTLDAIPLNWLYALTIGFAITGTWTLLANILGNLTNPTIASMIGIAENYFSFMLIIAIYIYSISHAQLLIATKQKTEPEETPSEENPLETIVKKIRQGVEEDRMFLNPQLNIEEFSRAIGCSYRDVSYAINKIFGTNFFEFINYYRIEEAKRLLAAPTKQKMSIMDVLLASGFNSKSAFQRFFKRLVGMSPTEFRIDAQAKNQMDN